ncbi:MAG: hypothetical protein FWG16_08760 [Micrococcales bacterium]|nr:hypothetical protein [Micrococcales bacterium]
MATSQSAGSQGIDYRSVLLQLGALTAALAVAGGVAGYLAREAAGMWGALMGALVTGLFYATSALVMHLGRTGGPQVQIRNLVISWFAKLIILFAAFIAMEQATWLHHKIFGLTVLIGVLGSLAIESRAVLKTRHGFDLPPAP